MPVGILCLMQESNTFPFCLDFQKIIPNLLFSNIQEKIIPIALGGPHACWHFVSDAGVQYLSEPTN